jgi:hypothetical protein
MVREVEFSNESEILAELENYSNDPDQPLFEGYLEDSGQDLKIKVHIPLNGESVAQRQLFLFFGNTDFDNKTIDYIKLEESDLDFRQDGQDITDRVYDFDLSKVLTIPRKLYNTGGTSEITIELYTYEANITTDYGTKTLSVPYSVHNDAKYEYDQSTDGVYRLIMTDFDPWTSVRTYGTGDIVVSGGALMVSNIDENTDAPTETSWSTPTDEEILYFSYGYTKHPPIRAFVTDMMISRYAKYELIRQSLLSKSYKDFDDEWANELTLLMQNLRERAKYKLIKHNPIDAAYSLQTLKIASSPQTDTTKINTYNIKYTT